MNDQRRIGALDNRRPGKRIAGREARLMVDRRRDEAAVELHVPRAGCGRARVVALERHLVQDQQHVAGARHDMECHDLDARFGDRRAAAELLLIDGGKPLHDRPTSASASVPFGAGTLS